MVLTCEPIRQPPNPDDEAYPLTREQLDMSLHDFVDCEAAYETFNDYLDDQAYRIKNLSPENGSHYRLPPAAGAHDPHRPSAPVQLDAAVLRHVDELSRAWNAPRSLVITTARALLLRGFSASGQEGDHDSSPIQNWQSYFSGDVYSIDCTRQEMMSTESLIHYDQQLKIQLETEGARIDILS